MALPSNYFQTKLPANKDNVAQVENWFSSLGDPGLACAGWASFSDDAKRAPYAGASEDSHTVTLFGSGSGADVAATQLDGAGPMNINTSVIYTRASEEGDAIVIQRMSMFGNEAAVILCPGASESYKVVRITRHVPSQNDGSIAMTAGLPKIIPLKSNVPDGDYPFSVCYAYGVRNAPDLPSVYFGFSYVGLNGVLTDVPFGSVDFETNIEAYQLRISYQANQYLIAHPPPVYVNNPGPSVVPITCPSDAFVSSRDPKNVAYAVTVITPSLDRRDGSVEYIPSGSNDPTLTDIDSLSTLPSDTWFFIARGEWNGTGTNMQNRYVPIIGSLSEHVSKGAFAEAEFVNTGYAAAYAQFRTSDRSTNASNVTAVSMDNIVVENGEVVSCRVNFVLAKLAPVQPAVGLPTVQIGPTALFSVGLAISYENGAYRPLAARFSDSTDDFTYSPIDANLVYNTSNLTEMGTPFYAVPNVLASNPTRPESVWDATTSRYHDLCPVAPATPGGVRTRRCALQSYVARRSFAFTQSIGAVFNTGLRPIDGRPHNAPEYTMPGTIVSPSGDRFGMVTVVNASPVSYTGSAQGLPFSVDEYGLSPGTGVCVALTCMFVQNTGLFQKIFSAYLPGVSQMFSCLLLVGPHKTQSTPANMTIHTNGWTSFYDRVVCTRPSPITDFSLSNPWINKLLPGKRNLFAQWSTIDFSNQAHPKIITNFLGADSVDLFNTTATGSNGIYTGYENAELYLQTETTHMGYNLNATSFNGSVLTQTDVDGTGSFLATRDGKFPTLENLVTLPTLMVLGSIPIPFGKLSSYGYETWKETADWAILPEEYPRIAYRQIVSPEGRPYFSSALMQVIVGNDSDKFWVGRPESYTEAAAVGLDPYGRRQLTNLVCTHTGDETVNGNTFQAVYAAFTTYHGFQVVPARLSVANAYPQSTTFSRYTNPDFTVEYYNVESVLTPASIVPSEPTRLFQYDSVFLRLAGATLPGEDPNGGMYLTTTRAVFDGGEDGTNWVDDDGTIGEIPIHEAYAGESEPCFSTLPKKCGYGRISPLTELTFMPADSESTKTVVLEPADVAYRYFEIFGSVTVSLKSLVPPNPIFGQKVVATIEVSDEVDSITDPHDFSNVYIEAVNPSGDPKLSCTSFKLLSATVSGSAPRTVTYTVEFSGFGIPSGANTTFDFFFLLRDADEFGSHGVAYRPTNPTTMSITMPPVSVDAVLVSPKVVGGFAEVNLWGVQDLELTYNNVAASGDPYLDTGTYLTSARLQYNTKPYIKVASETKTNDAPGVSGITTASFFLNDIANGDAPDRSIYFGDIALTANPQSSANASVRYAGAQIIAARPSYQVVMSPSQPHEGVSVTLFTNLGDPGITAPASLQWPDGYRPSNIDYTYTRNFATSGIRYGFKSTAVTNAPVEFSSYYNKDSTEYPTVRFSALGNHVVYLSSPDPRDNGFLVLNETHADLTRFSPTSSAFRPKFSQTRFPVLEPPLTPPIIPKTRFGEEYKVFITVEASILFSGGTLSLVGTPSPGTTVTVPQPLTVAGTGAIPTITKARTLTYTDGQTEVFSEFKATMCHPAPDSAHCISVETSAVYAPITEPKPAVSGGGQRYLLDEHVPLQISIDESTVDTTGATFSDFRYTVAPSVSTSITVVGGVGVGPFTYPASSSPTVVNVTSSQPVNRGVVKIGIEYNSAGTWVSYGHVNATVTFIDANAVLRFEETPPQPIGVPLTLFAYYVDNSSIDATLTIDPLPKNVLYVDQAGSGSRAITGSPPRAHIYAEKPGVSYTITANLLLDGKTIPLSIQFPVSDFVLPNFLIVDTNLNEGGLLSTNDGTVPNGYTINVFRKQAVHFAINPAAMRFTDSPDSPQILQMNVAVIKPGGASAGADVFDVGNFKATAGVTGPVFVPFVPDESIRYGLAIQVTYGLENTDLRRSFNYEIYVRAVDSASISVANASLSKADSGHYDATLTQYPRFTDSSQWFEPSGRLWNIAKRNPNGTTTGIPDPNQTITQAVEVGTSVDAIDIHTALNNTLAYFPPPFGGGYQGVFPKATADVFVNAVAPKATFAFDVPDINPGNSNEVYILYSGGSTTIRVRNTCTPFPVEETWTVEGEDATGKAFAHTYTKPASDTSVLQFPAVLGPGYFTVRLRCSFQVGNATVSNDAASEGVGRFRMVQPFSFVLRRPRMPWLPALFRTVYNPELIDPTTAETDFVFDWDFGDGTTITGTSQLVVEHAYLSQGPGATADPGVVKPFPVTMTARIPASTSAQTYTEDLELMRAFAINAPDSIEQYRATRIAASYLAPPSSVLWSFTGNLAGGETTFTDVDPPVLTFLSAGPGVIDVIAKFEIPYSDDGNGAPLYFVSRQSLDINVYKPIGRRGVSDAESMAGNTPVGFADAAPNIGHLRTTQLSYAAATAAALLAGVFLASRSYS